MHPWFYGLMFRRFWSRSRQRGAEQGSVNTVWAWSPLVFSDHGIWHVSTTGTSEALLTLENEINKEKRSVVTSKTGSDTGGEREVGREME